MERGALVPDDLTIAMVERPAAPARRGRGRHPRRLPAHPAAGRGTRRHARQALGSRRRGALYIEVDRDELDPPAVRPLGLHRRHDQHIYHVERTPPKVAGECDIDGAALVPARRRQAGDHPRTPGAAAAADVRGRRLLRRARRAAARRRRPAPSTRSPTRCCAPSPQPASVTRWLRDRRVTLKSARPDREDGRRRRVWWPTSSTRRRASSEPGVTTLELDRIAEEIIRGAGGIPSFIGVPGRLAPYRALAVHLDRRRGRPRHPGHAPHPRRARSCRSTPARSSTAGTATPRARFIVGDVPDAARTLGRRPRAGDVRGHRRRPRRATTSATSRPPSRTSPWRTATASCAPSSATASAPRCTRSRRSPTTAPASRGRRLEAGLCLAIEPMFTLGSARGARAATTAGPSTPSTARSRPTGSTRIAVTADGPRILTVNSVALTSSANLGQGGA